MLLIWRYIVNSAQSEKGAVDLWYLIRSLFTYVYNVYTNRVSCCACRRFRAAGKRVTRLVRFIGSKHRLYLSIWIAISQLTGGTHCVPDEATSSPTGM